MTDLENAVRERYARGAESREAALCCPSDRYEPQYLAVLPAEILERDYGCGDPSRWIGAGETVLDLGSGSGKAVYIMAQKVGPGGRAIGVDFNEPMLALARRHQDEIARRLGYANTTFREGRIQDLALDLERARDWLRRHPAHDLAGVDAFHAECDRLRSEEPMIADDSVDVVVSNCVLNLVRPQEKRALFREIHRVLRRGGRAVIADIVADEPPSAAMRSDPELWSGCISGALQEAEFVAAFEEAGFYGVEILSRAEQPWRIVEGIEFRSLTVRAYKGKQGPCLERRQAVVYAGPWKMVVDDDGHTLLRGERMAVCDKTFHLLTDARGPYGGSVLAVPSLVEVPLAAAPPFACRGSSRRDPRETKLGAAGEADAPGDASCSGGDCC